jgi:hypothetical protein
MKYLEKSFSVPVDGNDNYEKIFGHSGPLKILDAQKNPTRLSSFQKNSLYKKAKQLKTELSDILCTKTECDIPNEHNVNKMLHSEFKNKKKVEEFKNCMKAIGADSRDRDPEKLRR